MENISAAPQSKGYYYRFALSGFRWFLILSGFAFVLNGWILSVQKYLSNKTSVSFTVNETTTFLYPSITFCPGFITSEPSRLNNTQFLGMLEAANGEEEVRYIVANASYSRHDYLKAFSHPWFHDIARNDSLWVLSTPNMIFSGLCSTYNPKHESRPGMNQGIIFNLNYPNYNRLLNYLGLEYAIFIHDRDQLFYYRGDDDMPSSALVSEAQLRSDRRNLLSITYSRSVGLDTTKHFCYHGDGGNSFRKCYEREMAMRRGCQKPWLYFPEFDTVKCNRTVLSQMSGEEYYQPFMSALDRANKSGCLMPCVNSIYRIDYSYDDQKMSGNDTIEVAIYFKKFKFEYGEEYLVCDWTCLIGEIGGNFGFFLGGSVLMLYDFVHYRLRAILH